MDSRLSGRGMAEMVSAQLIFGFLGWLVIISGVAFPQLIFWRCLFGAVTLTVICGAMGILRRDALTWRQFGFAALGGIVLVIGWLLLFGSLKFASISVSTAIYHTQPFMLVILGAMFLGDRLTATKLVWLAVSFAGVILIALGKTSSPVAASHYMLGVAMAAGAALCYAVVTLLTMKIRAVRPHLVVLVQTVVGVIMLLPTADLAHPPSGLQAWACILAFGVIGTGLVYILLYSAYQKLPTHIVGILVFIYPVSAVIVDNFALGHRLQLIQLLGIALILFSVFGMTVGPRLVALKERGRR